MSKPTAIDRWTCPNSSLEILHRLNEAHDADLEALRVEVRRMRTAFEDLVNLCELDDVEIRCCQSCRRLGSAQDAYRCEDCLVAMCEACNDRAGLIGVDGDGASRHPAVTVCPKGQGSGAPGTSPGRGAFGVNAWIYLGLRVVNLLSVQISSGRSPHSHKRAARSRTRS